MTDIVESEDLDELRALWAEQAAKRADADARIAQLDEELRALREQQATERADTASRRADAAAQVAQLGKRIRTREAADAAGGIEILAPEVPEGGGETPREQHKFCSSPHPTDRYTSCKRAAGHQGDHVAYTFRISEPETWPVRTDLGDDVDDDGAE
jgi:hypothetical protein